MESAFSVVYLLTAISLGVLTIRNAAGKKEHLLFGSLALVLVLGDAFHLVPRLFLLNSSGTTSYTTALGLGTLVASITMTVFYVMLYHVWRIHYGTKPAALTISVYILAAVRIGLCLFPQNDWFSAEAPWEWGIFRNIPFAILGVLIMVIFYRKTKKGQDLPFRFMWLAVFLSFLFYTPVVFFVDKYPLFGLFMLPKTIMYVWIIWMGYSRSRADKTALRDGRKTES
jgi:hypothetical protein